MEQRQQAEQYSDNREITIYLKSADLAPDDADIEDRCARLREQLELSAPYCLGWLMASIEGTARSINEGDGRQLAWNVRAGLASLAAYRTVTAEQREEHNVANSTLPIGSEEA
jgi:hypothetical protein